MSPSSATGGTSVPAARLHHRWCRVLLLLAALLLCGLATRETNRLRDYRHGPLARSNSGYSAEVPPMLRFATVALGGFRGMIADALWLRVATLQEEGRFVELVQLSEWITALEPDNGEVWVYHAWNLAYNVSVMMSRPADRWRWVLSGIELLRDKGVRLNPSDAKVRHELGWFFQHKLGTDTDDAANYYRSQWAQAIATYLEPDGTPPPVDSFNAAELFEVFGLEAARMHAISARLGPLDWRVPGSHAVYWGLEAVERAEPRYRLSSRRVVYQSLIQMVRDYGRLLGDPIGEADYQFSAIPNIDLLDPAIAYTAETWQMHDFEGIRFALIGLLLEGVTIEARQGRDSAARAKYQRAGELAGDGASLPSYEDFVSGRVDLNWDDILHGG